MSPLILLLILGVLPLVLFALLRVKPLYLFVSIVSGYFGVQFLGEPTELIVHSLVRFNHVDVIVRVVMLLAPLVVTLLLMRKTLSTSSLPFQFILLVANSLFLLVFLLPLLTVGVQGSIYSSAAGNFLRQAHDLIITGVAGMHVLVMWIMRPKHHDEHHGKHKKH